MAEEFKRISAVALGCLGVLVGAAIAGFAAGFHARGGLTASEFPDLSASETVKLRFSYHWTENATASPVTLAFASADDALTLFSPTPVYPLTAANPVAEPAESSTTVKPVVQAGVAPTKAAPAATPRTARRSNAVLNDSQIASIKKRLNLTLDQERYWPAVEAELRKMEYKKDPKSAQGTRTAAIDMSKVNVEGLKSAGYPLVMSFNDDQRRELRSLAHLLGLESVMSTF